MELGQSLFIPLSARRGAALSSLDLGRAQVAVPTEQGFADEAVESMNPDLVPRSSSHLQKSPCRAHPQASPTRIMCGAWAPALYGSFPEIPCAARSTLVTVRRSPWSGGAQSLGSIVHGSSNLPATLVLYYLVLWLSFASHKCLWSPDS